MQRASYLRGLLPCSSHNVLIFIPISVIFPEFILLMLKQWPSRSFHRTELRPITLQPTQTLKTSKQVWKLLWLTTKNIQMMFNIYKLF